MFENKIGKKDQTFFGKSNSRVKNYIPGESGSQNKALFPVLLELKNNRVVKKYK